MRLLILNPPHPAIGSRIPNEHLPPLGLLAIGGPLIDAGHKVKLLDAEFGPMRLNRILREVAGYRPDALLVGHSGSTSAHPTVCEITRDLRALLPECWFIYGGVFPTYAWREILATERQIDVVVLGEAEETAPKLVAALEAGADLRDIKGIAFRTGTIAGPRRGEGTPEPGTPYTTGSAEAVRDLDSCRVGWELVDLARYSYWGDRKAVVAQFSRGCPHHCNYCGQQPFWGGWRHRDPVRFAKELAWLHREHGVEVINFADENPTASKAVWRAFLEALIRENVRLTLVGSTRASDIVRDADILHLYKRAGVARWLLGIESTDDETLRRIGKGSTGAIDREAIRLLREQGIISMAAFVTGFAEETDRDYWRLLGRLIRYDPDQIQALYANPHHWTGLARREAGRRVVQMDLGRWDYKHQVLASAHVPAWRMLLWMKGIEAVMQLRPKSLFRLLAHPESEFRAAMRWYTAIGRRVWPYEIWQWLFADRRTDAGPALGSFWEAQAGDWTMTGEPSSPAKTATTAIG